MISQDKLTILQYNTRKSRKEVMISLFENEHIKEVDIIALQEPWRNPWKNTTYHPLKSLFELVYEDGKNTRVCFYINKSIALASWSFTHHSPDVCSLHLRTFDGRTIHIHNVYNPCHSNVEDEDLSTIPTLLRAIQKHPNGEHISLEDYSLHHPMWGGDDTPHTDPGATDSVHFMHERNMDQVLPRGMTTYEEQGYKSTIDLVFATKLLVDSLISCNISDEHDHDSDHLPILSSWNLRTLSSLLKEKRYFKKTDIKKLTAALLSELTDDVRTAPRSTQELDQQVGILITALTKAIEVSTLILRVSPRSVLGFDEECKEAQMRARRLKKTFQKDPSPEL